MGAISQCREIQRRRMIEFGKKQETLERMRARAERCTIQYGEPDSKITGDLQQLVAKITDMERELQDNLFGITVDQMQMLEEIEQLHDPMMRTVMRMRYVDNMSWAEIGRALHYSRGGLAKMHNRALRQLDA